MENQNEMLVKELTNSPYTLIKHEDNTVSICFGRNLIKDGYKSFEEAEKEIEETSKHFQILIGTMGAVAKLVIDKYEQITNK